MIHQAFFCVRRDGGLVGLTVLGEVTADETSLTRVPALAVEVTGVLCETVEWNGTFTSEELRSVEKSLRFVHKLANEVRT